MYNSVKTVYSTALANSLLFDKDITILPNTTINEYFNKQTRLIDGKHKIDYYMIGLAYQDLLPENVTLDEISHKPTDVLPFRPIPFIVRRIEEDITQAVSSAFRMRVLFTKDNVDYVAYYLKKIDDIDERNNNTKVVVENNDGLLSKTDLSEFNPLSPTPSLTPNVFGDSVTYVSNSRIATVAFSGEEMNEIEEACNLLYPDKTKNIGEIALVSGIDTGYELEVAQTAFFIKTDVNIEPLNIDKPIVKEIEVGSIESTVIKN